MSRFPICTTLLHGFGSANRRLIRAKEALKGVFFAVFYAVFVFLLNIYDILHIDLFCKERKLNINVRNRAGRTESRT